MRCSACSEDVKPVVAIDLDGTLADYHKHFLRFAGMYLRAEALPVTETEYYDGTEPFREWFCRWFSCDVATFRDIKLAYRQGAQKRSMPAYPWAADLVNGLRECGAEVWLTTTRPYLRLDRVDPDTRFWLQFNGINYDGLLYDEDKYTVLANRVDKARVVAVLDDLPEQYIAAVQVFGEAIPIYRVNDFNRGWKPAWTVESLDEAFERIWPRVQEWKETHE